MHIDVEGISACALGELAEPKRQAVLEHCRRCSYCGDQLAVAMLLAVAADEPSSAGRTARLLAVRLWPAAAALVLAAGIVAFASAGFLNRTEGRPGERGAQQVTAVEEHLPMVELTGDERVQQEIVEGARWFAEATAAPISTGATEGVLPAIDLFDQHDYLGAAARLATVANLPKYGEIILGASLFYGDEFEGAEAVFERILAEALMADVGSGWDSNANTACYFLARIYYSTGRTDDARRLTRITTQARDVWSVPAEALVAQHLDSVFASGAGPVDGRRQARTDEELQSLVMERARYLFPPDLVGRGWPWETGVPAALDAFEAGDFLTAAAELNLVSQPAEFGPRGFHQVLLGISLYYAGEYEDSGRALAEVVGNSAALEERPPRWGFAKDAAAFYLARLSAHAGRFDDARRLAEIVSQGKSEWVPAAELLLNAL